ncbi:MAG: hypothetical protein AAFR82_07550, partial [Pseudomonadota bacterium]
MTAKKYLFGGAAALAIILAGCDVVRTPGAEAPADADTAATESTNVETASVDESTLADNPLLQTWDTPYGVP